MWFTKSKRAQSVNDDETWVAGGVAPTLNAFDVGDTRATVLILDGTRVDDVRVYDDELMPTVTARYGTGGGNVPAIYPIQGTMIGRADTAGPQGKGFGEETDPMFTLTSTDKHAVALYEPKSALEENWAESQVKSTLRAEASKSSHAITSDVTVRRLTPIECERLQGFPDNWTEGQADSHRYKQMGNAVAVPVVSFIIERLVAFADGRNT